MLEYNQLDSITLLEVITISFQVLSLKKKKKKKKKEKNKKILNCYLAVL